MTWGQVFEEMKSVGEKPTVGDYNVVMNAYIKTGAMKPVLTLFEVS